MVDERIVVRATLRDRLSRPLRQIEQQALRTSAALRSMCGVEGCLDHVEGKTSDLQKRIRALGQEVDKTGRKSKGLTTTQEKVAGAVDRAAGSTERLTDTQRRLKRRLDQSVRATGAHRNALGRFAKAGQGASDAIEAVGGAAVRHRDHLGRFARSTRDVADSSVRARDALGRFAKATDDGGQAAQRTSDDIDRLLGRVGDLRDAAGQPVDPWWANIGSPSLPARDARGRFTSSGGGADGGGGGGGRRRKRNRAYDIAPKFSRLSRVFVRGAKTADSAAGGIGKITGALGRLKKAIPGGGGGGLGALMGIAKLALLPTIVGPASSALGALGAGAIAAVQALAPLAGVVAALPAGILAMGTSVAAFKMAFKGVGEAVSVLNDPLATADQVNAALAGLTPEARAFARQLHTMKPAMDSIRSTVQAGLFPGMSDALDGIAGLLPVIERGMGAVGRALGAAGYQAGALFRSPAFSADLGTIMDGNARLVGKMGSGVVYLLSALRHVMVAAGPFVDWLGDMALGFAKWADASAQANRANGDTGRFLDKTQQRLTQFGHIIRDFAVAWANIFRLATPMADEGTSSLETMAAGFRRWTESAGGIEKISGWFAAMRPVLVEIGGLLKDVTFGILTLGQTSAPGTVGLLQTIRDMGPALMTLFQTAHDSGILASVVSILGSFAQVLSLVYGPLGPVLGLLATLAGWIAKLAADTGPAGSAFRGMITVILWGAMAFKAISLAITVAQGIMSAFRIVMLLARGAMLLFNLALLANPIVLVVALIALLIGGLVMLYKHSETARSIMDALGGVLKQVFLHPIESVKTLVGWIGDLIGAIGRIKWPSPPDWMKGGGWSFLPGVGDTPRPRGGGGMSMNAGQTLASHAEISAATPGRQRITSLQRTDALGSEKSDHRYGRAIDLQGSGLNTYASIVRARGGYAAFHGEGPTRHLHVVPPAPTPVAAASQAVSRIARTEQAKRPTSGVDKMWGSLAQVAAQTEPAQRATKHFDRFQQAGDVMSRGILGRFGFGDTHRPQYRTTPHVTRPLAAGDTLAPRAREAVTQRVMAGSVTVAEGAIIVQNPASDIDLRRAIADGLADYERERRERS